MNPPTHHHENGRSPGSRLTIGTLNLASNLLLSPIAGYCDLAFRRVVRPLGGLGLAYTALVNPRGILRRTVKSMELVETGPGDRPLGIQLYGSEPDEMADAARWCHDHGAATLDINMGCPVPKVCRRTGGAAVLNKPRLAIRLVEAVARAVDLPVTVKTRLGWEDPSFTARHLARNFESAGAAALIIHGRTARQRFGGSVDLDGIARVVEAVQFIPVIGNGDVGSPSDAEAMIRRTGCSGVMIGRTALGEPWIFRNTQAWLATRRLPPPPGRHERIALMNRHFDNLLELRGEHRACVTFRQRVSWYARTIRMPRPFRDGMRALSSEREYRALVQEFLLDADASAIAADRVLA
jgi:nifR3 family TIM-barrel protein